MLLLHFCHLLSDVLLSRLFGVPLTGLIAPREGSLLVAFLIPGDIAVLLNCVTLFLLDLLPEGR